MENITKKLTESKAQFNPFSPEIERVINTTSSQQEIWSDCIIGGSEANKSYNLSVSLKFTGNFIQEEYEKALQSLILRHESLRATFSPDGHFMCVYNDIDIKIIFHDLTDQTGNLKNEINTIVKTEVNELFDLVNGPLFKVQIIKIDDFEHLVTLTFHHIITDGLSIDLILEELSLLYSNYVQHNEIHLESPKGFSEYAEKINSFSDSAEFKTTEKYWTNIYKESVPTLELPLDFPRPAFRTYTSKRLDFSLDYDLMTQLKKMGKSAGCSLTTTLLVTYEIFLSKITSQKDLVVGLATSGNRYLNMPNLVGDCVNLLPLRSKIDMSSTFANHLKQRNSEIQKDYENRLISFGQILKNLEIPRDPSRIPLIPVAMTIDINQDSNSKITFDGLSHELKTNPRDFSPFEIQLTICKRNNNAVFEWYYNTSLFKPNTIINMMDEFKNIMSQIVVDSDIPLNNLLDSEKNYLAQYEQLNNTKTSYPNVSLSALLSEQAELTPDNIAIEYKSEKISYRELHKKVNQFAHYLEAQGVKPGDYIAVSSPRNPELVYAIMAVIQCGAAYLPLDHEYPSQRVEFMLEDAQAKFLITSKTISSSLPKCANTLLFEDVFDALDQYPSTKLKTYVDPENVIYLLYTSGSTGRPKGAKISNKNLVNLLSHMAITPGINEKDRVPFISTISFDIASFELFFPLFKGGVLVIPNHEIASDGRFLNEVLEKERISLIVGTPTTYQMLMDTGWTEKLPLKLLCCGEPLPSKLAKELIYRSNELWNLYGPTEVTIFSSFKHIKTEETLITVGPPIANMQYYILDENGNLLPENEVGEIAIAGDGVGKGYLGRPDLTEAKYVPNKFSNDKDAIMYLSGDMGKLLPTNEVACVGRKDHQVKVRGHRIEIGEIENTLMAIENVKSAVVLAKDDILVAFVVANEGSLVEDANHIRAWRDELAAKLPQFMIPHVFHILDKMPKTLNDKIDRKSLFDYKSEITNKTEYVAPRTKDEELVAGIWEESLNIKNIDIFGNFFEMGGHSLKALKIMTEIEKITGKRIPLSSLFKYSTVEKFAKFIKTDDDSYSDCLVPLKTSGHKTPLFIIHGAGLNVMNFVSLANKFDEDQPIYGIQGIKSNGFNEWYESIEEMAAHYIDAITKVNPSGPYAIAGFSFGGVVAFEMTRQLKQQGKEVSLTALLDSCIDSSYYYSTLKQKKAIRYLDITHRRFDYLIEMFSSLKGFKKRFNGKKDYVLKTKLGLGDKITEQEALALEQFTEANSMVNKIVDRYQLKPQKFKVDLFRSKDDDDYKKDPIYLGWKKAAQDGVTIHDITGKHLDIVSPPNDIKLARLLQNILDEKHASA
ncbi:non-ribosomal peptide synthetase [Flavobacterium agrisoli]|uniref:Amino acid adenylation domain-containing protein n=1 Tax=Flavobacterium agrisoli TaxID=2793066 RepID=A0A934PIP9_9FLAO|nr:non-ribosomal peptide synthetase [Flavobacterium agrisoli]MBK0368817.1 amino acid adenylation domain-containing protein [Flavobacterium agrisoli]